MLRIIDERVENFKEDVEEVLDYIGEENIVSLYGNIESSLYFIEVNKKLDRDPEDILDDPLCELVVAIIDRPIDFNNKRKRELFVKVEVEHV